MSLENRLKEKLLIFMEAEAGKLPPDPEEMNHARAEAAFRAIRAFGKDFGENINDFRGEKQIFMIRQNATDLLVDLGHLFDRLGVRFCDLLVKAKTGYEEETTNQGDQFGFLR